jgi:hypothetical protein
MDLGGNENPTATYNNVFSIGNYNKFDMGLYF